MTRKKQTKVAIVYDFDGTLAKGNIQENSFIPNLGISKRVFWRDVKRLAEKEEMDEILAYMYLLIRKARDANRQFDRASLIKHGQSVEYFEGVETYFDFINSHATSKNIKLKHYIVSSGTKEMIEGTTIKSKFDYIYASSFKFESHGVAEWPALAVNYTTKTQYLFRINKGIHNAWDNEKINCYTPEEARPIPFNNMIYIGDGLTDVPAMKVVSSKGGHSIGVYAPNSRNKTKVEQLLKESRVSYVAPADYRQHSTLVSILKAIIDQISARESIAQFGKK